MSWQWDDRDWTADGDPDPGMPGYLAILGVALLMAIGVVLLVLW